MYQSLKQTNTYMCDKMLEIYCFYSKWHDVHLLTSSWGTASSPSRLSPVWLGSSDSWGIDVTELSCALSYWPNDEPYKKQRERD